MKWESHCIVKSLQHWWRRSRSCFAYIGLLAVSLFIHECGSCRGVLAGAKTHEDETAKAEVPCTVNESCLPWRHLAAICCAGVTIPVNSFDGDLACNCWCWAHFPKLDDLRLMSHQSSSNMNWKTPRAPHDNLRRSMASQDHIALGAVRQHIPGGAPCGCLAVPRGGSSLWGGLAVCGRLA